MHVQKIDSDSQHPCQGPMFIGYISEVQAIETTGLFNSSSDGSKCDKDHTFCQQTALRGAQIT